MPRNRSKEVLSNISIELEQENIDLQEQQRLQKL